MPSPRSACTIPLTTAKAKEALKGLPLEYSEGPSTTGFIATLRGPSNGRTVLLRGDMDALPMEEDTGLEFSSTVQNAMHACGHDTHVAMLVAAAHALCAQRERLAGTVQFMFQPGEEGWHGARYMLEDGLIDPMPDAAYALHITPNIQSGVFAGRVGPAARRRRPHRADHQGQRRPRLAAARRGRSHPRRLRDGDGAAGDDDPARARLRSRRSDHRAHHGPARPTT
jgi:metal-dependent amidase/aminoacylase/carboxypeptidase family protein